MHFYLSHVNVWKAFGIRDLFGFRHEGNCYGENFMMFAVTGSFVGRCILIIVLGKVFIC